MKNRCEHSVYRNNRQFRCKLPGKMINNVCLCHLHNIYKTNRCEAHLKNPPKYPYNLYKKTPCLLWIKRFSKLNVNVNGELKTFNAYSLLKNNLLGPNIKRISNIHSMDDFYLTSYPRCLNTAVESHDDIEREMNRKVLFNKPPKYCKLHSKAILGPVKNENYGPSWIISRWKYMILHKMVGKRTLETPPPPPDIKITPPSSLSFGQPSTFNEQTFTYSDPNISMTEETSKNSPISKVVYALTDKFSIQTIMFLLGILLLLNVVFKI